MVATPAEYLVALVAPNVFVPVCSKKPLGDRRDLWLKCGRALLLKCGSLLVPKHVIEEVKRDINEVRNPCRWIPLAMPSSEGNKFFWNGEDYVEISDDLALLHVDGLFGKRCGLQLGFMPRTALRRGSGNYALLGFHAPSDDDVPFDGVRFRSWPLTFDDMQIVEGYPRFVFRVATESISNAIYNGQSGAIVVDCESQLPIGFHVSTTPSAYDGCVSDVLLFSELRHELEVAAWAPCIRIPATTEHEIERERLSDLKAWVKGALTSRKIPASARRWIVIEGPAGSGKSVLAAQFLNGVADRVHVLRFDPAAITDTNELGFCTTVCLDPIGRDIRSGRSANSPGLQAMLAHIRDHVNVAIFCTRSRSLAAEIRAKAEESGIKVLRVCLDVLSPSEKRLFVERELEMLGDPELTDEVLRIFDRLPSSPALMRAFVELGADEVRRLVELSQKPEIGLSHALMAVWADREAAGPPELTHLLGALAAVQVLRVDLSCLVLADPFLNELGLTRVHELIVQLESKGYVEWTGIKNEVRLIGLPQRLLVGRDNLISRFGVADPEQLRSRYRRRLYASINRVDARWDALVDAALITFDQIFLKGSFDDLQADEISHPNSGGRYADAAEVADALFRDEAGRFAIKASLVDLLEEAFAPGTGRSCAERIQLCRLVRRILCNSALADAGKVRHSTESCARLRTLFEDWWIPNRQTDSEAEFDGFVAAEALMTDAALSRIISNEPTQSGKPVDLRTSFSLSLMSKFEQVCGHYTDLVWSRQRLLLPAVVRTRYEPGVGSKELEGFEARAWVQPRGAPRWSKSFDMRWIEVAVLTAEDARPRTSPAASPAMIRARGGLTAPDPWSDLPHRLWFQSTRAASGEYDDIALIAFLILAGRKEGDALRGTDGLFVFNANFVYWLAEIFDHAALKATVRALYRSAQEFDASADGRCISVSLRTALVCADEIWATSVRA